VTHHSSTDTRAHLQGLCLYIWQQFHIEFFFVLLIDQAHVNSCRGAVPV
jgi:hypothetical protein